MAMQLVSTQSLPWHVPKYYPQLLYQPAVTGCTPNVESASALTAGNNGTSDRSYLQLAPNWHNSRDMSACRDRSVNVGR